MGFWKFLGFGEITHFVACCTSRIDSPLANRFAMLQKHQVFRAESIHPLRIDSVCSRLSGLVGPNRFSGANRFIARDESIRMGRIDSKTGQFCLIFLERVLIHFGWVSRFGTYIYDARVTFRSILESFSHAMIAGAYRSSLGRYRCIGIVVSR